MRRKWDEDMTGASCLSPLPFPDEAFEFLALEAALLTTLQLLQHKVETLVPVIKVNTAKVSGSMMLHGRHQVPRASRDIATTSTGLSVLIKVVSSWFNPLFAGEDR